MDQKWLYRIAINMVPKVGAVTAKNLIAYSGSAEEVFKASAKSLRAIPGVGDKIISYLKNPELFRKAEAEIAFLTKYNVHPLFYSDPDYPHRLKNYSDSPAILYYNGNTDLNSPRIVGIVGTRKPTVQGKVICEELIEGLKSYQVVTISGLAYGIDITAHKKCLKVNIPTIGVLGHGLRRIYPPQHFNTAKEMMKNGGLLTEFFSDTKPDRERFPMRNRIIAGLCDALIVVETGKSGGSMITAQFANQYNKDVFAVPGRLTDLYSKGCNHLIKTHRAALIESAEDIGYVMRWDQPDMNAGIQTQLFTELTEPEQQVVDYLKEVDQAGIDSLAYQLRAPIGELTPILLNLELQGIITSLPGSSYTLIKRT